jgi:hypothetical protein
VVVTWNEIKAVRRLVKQILVEMLQECSSAGSCTHMQPCTVIEEHYTQSQDASMTLFVETRTVTSYVTVYKVMSHVTLPCMPDVCPAPTLVA